MNHYEIDAKLHIVGNCDEEVLARLASALVSADVGIEVTAATVTRSFKDAALLERATSPFDDLIDFGPDPEG